MTRLDPVREIVRFAKQADDSLSRYTRVYDALAAAPDSNDLRKGIAVDAIFRLGAEFEHFQHQWHVAAIAQDSTRVIESARKRAEKQINGLDASSSVLFDLTISRQPRTHLLTREQIEKLVDPLQRNLTFSNVRHWLSESGKQLSVPYLIKIQTLDSNSADSCIVDLLKSIRNAIAHGSTTATAQLNEAVRARIDDTGITGKANLPLIRKTKRIDDIGTYLNSWVGSGTRNTADSTRVALLHNRIVDIAESLA